MARRLLFPGSMNVLLAEESRVVRSFMRSALRTTRYAEAPPIDVTNGGDLLKILKAERGPDTLVLLDWNLPGLDVPTLLAHLGRRGILRHVSILLCVNAPQVPLAQEAMNRGARGFVTRPYSNDDLRAAIGRIESPVPTPSVVLKDIATRVRVQQDLPSLLSLPSSVISLLFEGAKRSRHEAGDVVLRPGDRVDDLSFVTLGEVEIVDGAASRRGAGECFAERAFICGEASTITVRARTALEVVAVAKESMVELARRHPSLQNFLTALLNRRTEPEADSGVTEIFGTLVSLPFSDLLQFLSSAKKSGMLLLESEGRQGRIYFEQGEVCDARESTEAGPEAFRRLAGWTEAKFEFKAGASSGARTIYDSTMKLLMSCFLEAPADSALCAKVG